MHREGIDHLKYRESGPLYRPILRSGLDSIPQVRRLSDEDRLVLQVVSAVIPFRVNRYIVDRLIDWNRVPDDPIYQLTFPQRGMLSEADFDRLADLIRSGAGRAEIDAVAREIQFSHNPHPAEQMALNVPRSEGEPLAGIQHKYRQTVLFFPSQGQTCHAYCTYCFRWPQFVGIEELRFASHEAERLVAYVARHPEVTDVLLTGGDPFVMKTDKLRSYLEALVAPEVEHLVNIRIGTKALTYWPYRFIEGEEADSLLALLEEVRNRGKQVAIMAHVSHPRELRTETARTAVRRLMDAGCVVRSQAPLIRHVNDDPRVWSALWSEQLKLGIVPYYMFVERDTGPKDYFAVSLARALDVYREAIQTMGGLGRTVRGPSMSAGPGKICVEGVADICGERVFVLSFLQGRNPDWVKRPFFARFDPRAAWIDDLLPAFDEDRFFFEEEYAAMSSGTFS
jgi:KamA family protein